MEKKTRRQDGPRKAENLHLAGRIVIGVRGKKGRNENLGGGKEKEAFGCRTKQAWGLGVLLGTLGREKPVGKSQGRKGGRILATGFTAKLS